MNLSHLSNQELFSATQIAVRNESEATRLVLLHLLEVEKRKLYLERGFPSLFEFCVQVLGYCAGSAQIRIQSMRLIRELPAQREEIIQKLENGTLKLTQLATVQKLS